MRLQFILPLLALTAALQLHAGSAAIGTAPEPTPEEKARIEFAKGLSTPNKSARASAVSTFEKTKPAATSSWQMFYQTAVNDPEGEVRMAAFAALARMPAHDAGVGKLLVAAFNTLKPNDMTARIAYAKAMDASEFKADVVGALADQLSKMRYAEDPRGYRGKPASDKAKEEAKQKRDELMAMLDAFNVIAKSDVTEANKETPVKVRKWWDANQDKFLKDDAELAAKYSKADADAAKAAKEAAKAAKEEAKK